MQLFSRKEVFVWALAVLLVLNLATLGTILWQLSLHKHCSHQKSDEHKKGRKKEHATKHWLKEMGLSENEILQLRQIRDEFRENSKAHFEQIAEFETEIFDQMALPTPDSIRLMAIADSIGVFHGAVRREGVRNLLQVKEITTPEQFHQFNERMHRMMMRQHPQLHRMQPRKECGKEDKKEKWHGKDEIKPCSRPGK